MAVEGAGHEVAADVAVGFAERVVEVTGYAFVVAVDSALGSFGVAVEG